MLLKIKLSLEKRRSLSGYVFILPWVIGFAIFLLYPLISNLIMSLGKITDLVGLKTTITGFQNYIKLFNESKEFLPAFYDTLKNTFLWTPFIIVFSLFLAILLNKKIKFKGIFRVVFFMPVLLGSGYIMQQLSGAANILQLPENAIQIIGYYFNADIAKFLQDLLTQIMHVFWKSGVQIVIFLSGLQSIPESYYEAARVDNANGWDSFWKITLPILSPIVLLNIVYTMIESFRDTDNKIADLIVKIIFKSADYEYGAAMGWVYFVVTFAFIGLIFFFSRRLVYYEK